MDSPERLLALERWLRGAGARVRRGGDFDRWDIEVEVGALMRARLLMGIEEHGGGAQLVRLRLAPRFSAGAVILLTALGTAVLGAGFNHAAAVTFTFVGLLTGTIAWLLWEAALLYGAIADAVEQADSDATPLSRLKHRKGVRLES
jgi:O-antigen biosynthesis protein